MLRRLILATGFILAVLPAAARENHALLIGASTYPNLDPQFWLKGPANDVRLVSTYLTTAAPVPFSVDRVKVLADGVDGAEAPTLAAIRAAFADLAATVQPGDFVYIHFSGHGSQAPALDPEAEMDGLDELFLPVDVGPWNDSIGVVQNALVDDEIGAMLDALTDKGANVWVVFDSCHSGTATRAAPSGDDEVRVRQLPPEALGLTADRMAEAEAGVVTRGVAADPRARPEAPVVAGNGKGSVVAFFAAQTNEVTPEKNMPKGKPGRVPQGVFTWTLFEVLAEYPGATYGQVAQEVLRKYSIRNLARSTPLFEGDLDRVVFGGDPAPRLAQWPATRQGDDFTLPAGSLHGLTEGSRLVLLASAADPLDRALGEVTILEAGPFSATAAAVAALPDGLPRGLVARKVTADMDFSLTVALPEAGTAPAAALEAALAALMGQSGPRIAFVDAGAEADLRLAVIPDSPRPDALWVLPATGLAEDLALTPSVSTSDKTPEDLAAVLGDTLAHMAKALNILKMGGAVGGAGGPAVEVRLLTRTPETPTLVALDTGTVPRLVPDDQLHVEVINPTDGPVDVNILYVGSDWSISHMHAARLQPADRLRKGLRITDSAFGRDRMVVVVSPARPQSAVEHLGFLAQDELQLTRGGTTLAAALREAGFGQTTRAAVGLDDEEPGAVGPAILQFEVDTVPGD